jgi:hypothetical protein
VFTRSFLVTVRAINDAPVISYIANQRVEPNYATPPIPFTIEDAETPVASLRLSVASSNPAIIPLSKVLLTGSGSNRTVQVQPLAGLTGSSVITISVSDGLLTASSTFTVSVQPGNTAPSISSISNQVTDTYHELPPVSFVVSDQESDPASLIVSASSFNQLLLPDSGIVLGGSGASRTVTLRPAARTGYATIALTVTDGRLSTRSSFMLTVNAGVPLTDQLLLEKEGEGTISPDLNGQQLQVGKNYTVAAVPGPGQVFAGWSGSVTSGSPNLSFQMASNLVLHARFIANPFSKHKGTFNGLFYEPDAVRQESSGFITVALTDRGSFSGKLLLAGKSLPFRGTLNLDCSATVIIPRPQTNGLTMQVNFGAGRMPEGISGQISDGAWLAELQGDRAVYHSRTNPAPFAGAYTVAIPGSTGDPFSPAGDGIGTLKIDGGGLGTFTGVLADGTKVAQRVPLSKAGNWPLYGSLYTGKGSLLSWMTITNRLGDDLTGIVSWIKPGIQTAKYYPVGFTNEVLATGSSYAPPVPGHRALDLTAANIVFSRGNLRDDFVNQVALDANNKFSNLSTNKLTLALAPTTGLLTGTVIDPSTGQLLKFSSVLLQKQVMGRGFLLGTNRSSQVVLFQ